VQTQTPAPTSTQAIEETQALAETALPLAATIILSPLETMQTGSRQVLSLAWLADSSRFAAGMSGTEENNLLIGNPMTGEWPLQIATGASRVSSVAWSPDGSALAIAEGRGNRLFSLLEAETGTPTMTATRSEVTSLAWSPNGRVIALGTAEGNIVLWDSEAEETEEADESITALAGSNKRVDSIAWSPDGTKLATAVAGDVILWGRDESLYKRLNIIQDAGESVTWSPDGSMLATPGSRGGIWNAETGELLLRLSSITNLSWAPDSTMIVADDGKDVIVLDVETGSVLFTAQGHTRSVTTVAWSPDGAMIVSGDEDGVVMVWGIKR